MTASTKLVRFLVTFSVTFINLFFKIAGAKVNRVLRRISIDEWHPPGTTQHNTCKTSSPLAEGERLICARHREDARPNGHPYELRQCVAQSKLPAIGVYVQYYYAFTHLYNWYLLIKNSILYFLRHEAFAGYRYLDCFLLGRLIINGRAIEVVPACACYASAMRLIWHYTMMRRTPEFRMPCIEFLLDREGHEHYWSSRGSHQDDKKDYSQLLEYKNPFELTAGGVGPEAHQSTLATHKLRPNRTRNAWDALAKVTTTHHAIFFAFYTFLFVLFYLMGQPIVLTQRGFQYNYRYCIKWAMDNRSDERQRPQTLDRSSLASTMANRIYDAFLEAARYGQPGVGTNELITGGKIKPSREFFPPYDNVVSLSTFNMLRIALEALETFIIYLELTISYNSASYMSFLMSKDITYYCKSINSRLERLISLFRSTSLSSLTTVQNRISNHHYDSLHYVGNRASRLYNSSRHVCAGCGAFHSLETSQSEIVNPTASYVYQPTPRSEVSDIQAQIADLFTLIDTYNKYISLQSMCLLVTWLGYSALVSSWIFLPGNENPKMEWYVAHVGATLYVFIMLWSMSNVKTSCLRLYRLITIAMALDEDYKTGKTIWVSLLKYYSPRPLYCFTLVGSIEITYMLGLKLLVWLLSALLVASSFFQVYNIK